jgi:hypothetical protein
MTTSMRVLFMISFALGLVGCLSSHGRCYGRGKRDPETGLCECPRGTGGTDCLADATIDDIDGLDDGDDVDNSRDASAAGHQDAGRGSEASADTRPPETELDASVADAQSGTQDARIDASVSVIDAAPGQEASVMVDATQAFMDAAESGVIASDSSLSDASNPNALLGDIVQVAAGGTHTCAVFSSGRAKCWGANGSGQLGNGTQVDSPTPKLVEGLTDAVQIVAGTSHTCARRASGVVVCWGSNAGGQLGDGTTASRSAPGAAALNINATTIDAGGNQTCAISSDKVYCWGGGQNAEPTSVYLPTGGFREVGVGEQNACARFGQNVSCWGAGRARPPSGSTISAAELALGTDHMCALYDGAVMCMGANDQGQLGVGNFNDSSIVENTILSGGLEVEAGSNHTCARRTSGAVSCWGSNSAGQLGNGSTTTSSTPVLVSELASATALAAGATHTCALVGPSAIKCWGANGNGQLGDGSMVGHATPVTVAW